MKKTPVLKHFSILDILAKTQQPSHETIKTKPTLARPVSLNLSYSPKEQAGSSSPSSSGSSPTSSVSASPRTPLSPSSAFSAIFNLKNDGVIKRRTHSTPNLKKIDLSRINDPSLRDSLTELDNLGTPKSASFRLQAKHLFEKSNLDRGRAMKERGDMFFYGSDKPQNEEDSKNKKKNENSAPTEEKDEIFQTALKELHSEWENEDKKSEFVEKNLSKAIECYMNAASHGNDDAQFILGQFFRQGIYVPKDYSKAFEFVFFIFLNVIKL